MRRNFLISGMPRCRTAWLTAFFNAHGTRVWHDAYVTKPDWKENRYNVIDPSIAMIEPRKAFPSFDMCFHVRADDVDDRIQALMTWADTEMDPEYVQIAKKNIAFYMACTPGFHVDQLDDNDFLDKLTVMCLGHHADPELIEIFQILKIEEHFEKATTRNK